MTAPASVRPVRRIGLFGGSFDPVHQGHRALADAAMAQLGLDELRWVVAGQPWQKQGRLLAPAADRLAMVEAAIAGAPGQRVERIEVDRAGPSYTIDTVTALQAAAGSGDDWWLLIGQDQHANFCSWRDWPALLGRVGLAVAARDGIAPQPPAGLAAVPHRWQVLHMPAHPASATTIRRRLAGGEAATHLAPDWLAPGVADLIERRGLYHPVPAQPVDRPASPDAGPISASNGVPQQRP
ncbi:nicotinate (nicotinamide) nucleotide adenylyltransferase [Leptothrix discophora]|uniref:Probable nicotinate-nucleotide adenylyltransferase n=1 Tax=Leptothrix discophora TaxID=89 RepID=A0ABT9FZ41_LEPDI|nr:nicotinate (nicotinamide) nucleotide adenylyltransferase [Leptothrix discophora]MDP4299491.1 nicotinate (nicotinamide) nucleotide adenylyltransferase [Leptothrix discophora]